VVISTLYLESECTEFKDKLHGEEDCEDDVEDVQELGVQLRLLIELHGQGQRVDEDQAKMVYSKTGEVTKAHNLYCTGFLGMYLLTGFAFNANSMQFRCNRNAEQS
jgi:hypothetical protein